MANDYSDINLSPNLQSLTGPVSQSSPTGDQLKEYIDNKVNEILRPGGINYTNIISSGRSYTAIVDTSNAGGAFTDIQDAINYVNSLGGGSVYIKKGTYVLTALITLYSNIEIIGEDPVNTIIDCNLNRYYFSAVGTVGTKLSNIKIVRLKFKQFRDSTATNGAIFFNYITASSIIECQFTDNYSSDDAWGPDIYLVNSDTILVSKCTSTNSGQSVRLSSTTDSIIDFLYTTGNKHDAIATDGGATTKRMIVRNCSFNNGSSTQNAMVYSDTDMNDSIIIGNTFTNLGSISGIYFLNLNSMLINNNFFNQNSGTIYPMINLDHISKISITGNFIGSAGSDGIQFGTTNGVSSFCNVTGNLINNNSGYGVDIVGGTSIAIVGNAINGNTLGTTNNGGTLNVIASNS